MRSLHSAILFLALAIVSACSHPVGPYSGRSDVGINLPVSFQYQTCPVWCWAASVAMIANYYDKPYSQCQIASIFVKGASSRRTFCCGSDDCKVCASQVTGGELRNLLNGIGIDAELGVVLSEQELQAELLARRPVVIFLLGKSTNHYVVIAGFRCPDADGCVYRTLDPAVGEKEFKYSSLLKDEKSRSWDFTVYGISRRSKECFIRPGQPPKCGN